MNRTVVVTDAQQEMGWAIALAFAADGDIVLLTSPDGELSSERVSHIQTTQGNLYPMRCDPSQEDQVRDLMNRASGERNQIDVLVNAAGITLARPLIQATIEEWRRLLDSNLRSVFLTTRYALPFLYPGSAIVILVPTPYPLSKGWGAQEAVRWAVIGFTEALRAEMRESGIRVIAVQIAAERPPPSDVVGQTILNALATPAHVTVETLHLSCA